MRYQLIYGRRCMRAPPSSPLSALWGYLELPPIGWQLFILGNSKSDSTAFPLFLDTYATRLLAEPLRSPVVPRPSLRSRAKSLDHLGGGLLDILLHLGGHLLEVLLHLLGGDVGIYSFCLSHKL